VPWQSQMSLRLNIPLESMDGLARQSRDMVKLGSYCTVFSGTEVLENIRRGKKVPDIVKGLFFFGHQKGTGDGFADREGGDDRRCCGP